jgi:hypothetical protein
MERNKNTGKARAKPTDNTTHSALLLKFCATLWALEKMVFFAYHF